MPDDPLHDAPATAEVSLAAGGNLVAIAYTWSHPQDGPQEGLLAVGPSAEPGRAVALWGDSWHQRAESRVLVGTSDAGLMTVSCEYAGEWRWQITVDSTNADSLKLRMDNVVPASAATQAFGPGPYPAMITDLRRS